MEQKHEKMIERIYSELVGDEYTEGLIPWKQKVDRMINNHTIFFRIAIGLFTVLVLILAAIADTMKIF